MSLAEELKKLADLKVAGLLTEEEFKEAKGKVLTEGAHGVPQPEVQATPKKLTPDVTKLLHTIDDSMDVENAVDMLGMLVGNILSAPDNVKYRSIKTTNAKLAASVFKVQGSKEFLESIGFEKVRETVYMMGMPDIEILKEAREQLSRVKFFREMRDRDQMRKKIANEIRHEKRQGHVHNGTIIQYCRDELLGNESTTSISWLKKILCKVIASDDPAFRRVNVTPAFYEECWALPGTQELLLDIARWEVSDDCQVLQLPLNSFAEQQHEAIKFLEGIEVEWQQRAMREEEAKRENARAELKAVFDARRRQTQKSTASVHHNPTGKKIPISEALKYLTGNALSEPVSSESATQTQANREEDATATSLINDVAAFMEIAHEASGAGQGLRNPGRIEANRLRQKFADDRDIGYLHDLKEEWERKAKERKHGL